MDAICTAAQKRAKQINILGGESLLHPKLNLICEYNAHLNLKTTVYTNGTLLANYKLEDFHGAKIRVSLDSLSGTQKSVFNFTRKEFIECVDANYMITTKTDAKELLASANWLENRGCKTFFMFNMQELVDNRDFFDCSGNKLILPVMKYKKINSRIFRVI